MIYDQNYIIDHHGKLVGDPALETTNTVRSLRSFDDYLALGYTRGLMRFDGTEFSVMNLSTNVLYINKTKDGQLLYDRTQGLFVVDDDFSAVEEIPTEKGVTGNRLKFLVDGDLIYYTLNSRLFRLDTVNGNGISEEVTIPYIKGSIVELSKIRFGDKDGDPEYKYVIGSQTQLYITDSLEGDRLADYESFDATNGLHPIIANTSGYYDESEQKYYLQSTNGVFVYDFNKTRDIPPPVKIVVSSVDLDGEHSYGDRISIGKDGNDGSTELRIEVNGERRYIMLNRKEYDDLLNANKPEDNALKFGTNTNDLKGMTENAYSAIMEQSEAVQSQEHSMGMSR